MPLPKIHFEVVAANESQAELHQYTSWPTQRVTNAVDLVAKVLKMMTSLQTTDPYDGAVRAVIRWVETKPGKRLLEAEGSAESKSFLRNNLYVMELPALPPPEEKEVELTDEMMERGIKDSETEENMQLYFLE